MKIVCGVIVTLWLEWMTTNVAGGLLARFNGQTIQTLHFQSNLDWSDYCHPYRQYSFSPKNTFSVVCRSLGYEGLSAYSDRSYSRGVTKTYRLYFINCAGTESSLEECRVSYTSSTWCYYYYQVICQQCAVGSVRLTGGLIPQQGQVEVCLNGSWSRVCSSSWNQRDAVVVCRQLNFPVSELSYSTKTVYKLQNAGFIASNRSYKCYGNESRLIDCKYSVGSSCLSRAAHGYYEYPVLHCKGDVAMTSCTSGRLRLYKGVNENEGNLQICTNGTWSQVTSYDWDSLDGEVACRQLGLLHSGGTTIKWLYTSDLVLRSPLGFRCVGSERRLQDCPYSITTSNYNGVFLRCQALSQSRVTCRGEGQVRLVGGSTANEGRVEICMQGVWGSICRSSWDNSESAIVCEYLGFQSENSTIIYNTYGDGNKPILLSDLYCNQDSSSLLQCSRRSKIPGAHTCSGLDRNNTVAVRCDDSTCRHGDLRLYGGYVSFEGVPEICINGKWAYTCQSSWDLDDSTVFCRHLLNVQNVKAIQSYSTQLRQYPTSRMRVSNVTCSLSSQRSFTGACSFSVGNSSCSYLTVGCYVSGCTNGSVRILSASSSNDGVVEVCQDGVWGSIISYSWDSIDARVICKQLGRPWQKSLASNGFRQSSLVWERARCSGNENSIFNCPFSSMYGFSTSTTNNPILYRYPSSPAAAVICRGNGLAMSSNRCTQGAIRLANKTQTSTLLKGRLEVCDDGEWKVVCYSGYWPRMQTELVCKELFNGLFSKVFNRYESSGGAATQGIISSMYCSSNATMNITYCNLEYSTCSGTSFVGISCEDITYEVNIMPMTSYGSYELGSTANFSCSITPTPIISPPNILRYFWTIPGTWSTMTFSSFSSLYIDYKFTKLNDIHCEVQDNNSFVFGSGYYILKVNNPLQVINENSYQTLNGSTYIEVDIANTTPYSNLMSELALYNDDYLVSRVNLTLSGGTNSLQAHVNPGGDFKVRFEGFLTVPFDRTCEKYLLDALEIYPAFKGVQTSFTKKDNGPERKILSVSTNHGSSNPVLYTVNESVIINFVVDLTHDFDKEYYLYIFEGTSYKYFTTVSNTDYWSGTFKMSTPTFTTVLLTIILYFYSTEFESNCESYYFVQQLLSYSLIKERKMLQVNYYENLSHIFSAEKFDYYDTESTNISCYGSIGIPLFRAVSISKTNVTLSESESGTVKFSTSSLKPPQQQYGVYTCTLYAREGVKFIKEIHLNNRVIIEAMLEFIQLTMCRDDKAYIKSIVTNFTHILHQICNCAINSSHISNATLSCPGSSSSHGILNATLTYSNDNGIITATSVAQMLYAATLAQTEKLVIGEHITIRSVRFSNGSKFNVVKEASGQSQSITTIVGVGSFFVGVFLTLFCLGIVIIAICCRMQKSSSMDVPNSGVSCNMDNESKYTAGPKSSHNKGEHATEALNYEEPVEQSKSMPCDDADMEQPLYEHVDHLQKEIVMTPNLGYEGVAISRM